MGFSNSGGSLAISAASAGEGQGYGQGLGRGLQRGSTGAKGPVGSKAPEGPGSIGLVIPPPDPK